jgi:hypothetical protein
MLNLAHIHMDPRIWGDPEIFRPERFLDESGSLLKHPALVPFGLGKNNFITDICVIALIFNREKTVLGRGACKKQFVPLLCWNSTKIQLDSPEREGASFFGPNWWVNFSSERIQS